MILPSPPGPGARPTCKFPIQLKARHTRTCSILCFTACCFRLLLTGSSLVIKSFMLSIRTITFVNFRTNRISNMVLTVLYS